MSEKPEPVPALQHLQDPAPPSVLQAQELGPVSLPQEQDLDTPPHLEDSGPTSLPALVSPQGQEKRGILAKLRRKSSSVSTPQGRSQQRSQSQEGDRGPDDSALDSEMTQDSERTGRRLSSLVHGVQSLKRRLAARQLSTADSERRLHRSSLDSRSSDGSELSSSGSESVAVGSNRSSLLSNTSTSSEESSDPARTVQSLPGYRGPIVGRARARVDYVPSPYDREALRFSRGDVIDVISMNPSGLWRGALYGRVGTFKFINVEVLRDERARREEEGVSLPPFKSRPETVQRLLDEIGLPEYASIFSLHGFDRVEDFHALEADQLSELGIVQPEHRSCLLAAAQVLTDDSEPGASDPLLEFAQPLLSELIRDSGCYDVWRLTEETSTDGASGDRSPSPAGAAGSDGPPAAAPEQVLVCGRTVVVDGGEGGETTIVHARPVSVTPEQDRVSPEEPHRAGESDSSDRSTRRSSSPPRSTRGSSSPPQSTRGSSSPPRSTRGSSSPPRSTRGSSSPPRSTRGSSSPPRFSRASASPERFAPSAVRPAVDFERKFQSARSVFERQAGGAVRRQIPVGVRSRTAAFASCEAVIVGDEVNV